MSPDDDGCQKTLNININKNAQKSVLRCNFSVQESVYYYFYLYFLHKKRTSSGNEKLVFSKSAWHALTVLHCDTHRLIHAQSLHANQHFWPT